MNPSRLRPHRRPHRAIVAAATLLVAFLPCNSIRADAPTTAPAATQPAERLTAQQRRTADELKEIVTHLASDELEGRGVQTEGLNKAANYIAEHFERSGLKPLPGIDGYFQPFTITLNAAVGDETRLTVGGMSLDHGEDFTPLVVSAEGEFDASVAFVGYSIAAPEFHYDDFQNIDLEGKVALALRYEPTDTEGKSRFEPDGRSEHAAFLTKAAAAADRGAVALLIVNPPGEGDEPDQLQPMRRLRAAPGVDRASIPVIQITRAQANSMLERAGVKSLNDLQRAIDENLDPQSFALDNLTVEGKVQLERAKVEVKNVVGYVPGTVNPDEYIVIGAHYDHLGRGETGTMSLLGRRDIHNGADDNASGTAAIMQAARRLAQHPAERSVIFIAFTAEERGLLGSTHFVNNSPVALEKIVAMVNLDMVGRVKGDALQVGGTGTAAQFDTLVERVDERSPLEFKVASAFVGGRGGVGPSDHAAFAAKKIPVLFFWTGTHIDYHRPTDDAHKLNYAGLAQVVDASVELIDELATMPRTQYVDAFDRSGARMGTVRVRLGIMPDYGADVKGVRVGTTLPDTPAANAGIREGDVIVRIGDDDVASLTDYMRVLNQYKAGDTIMIGVERDGEHLELETTLAGRRG